MAQVQDGASLPQSTVMRLAWGLLIFALAVGLSVRLYAISEIDLLLHDDSISYLAAAGHQLDYESAPFGQPVSNEIWHGYLQPDTFLPLATIADGLARTDIHPPMYFWLLNVAVFFTGDTLYTGAILNLILQFLTLIALYRFASALLDSRWRALLVCAVWFLGSATLDATLATRQYALSTLLAVLFSHTTFIWFYRPDQPALKRHQIVIVALLAAAGMLTLYYFALVIIAGVTAVTLRSLWSRDRRIMLYLLALIAGAGIFFLAYPQILAHYDRILNRFADESAAADPIIRGLSYVQATLTLFFQRRDFVAAFAIIAALRLVLYLLRPHGASLTPRSRLSAGFWLTGVLFVIGLAGLLYLSPSTPEWAFGRKYFLTGWLFLSFLPVVILTIDHRRGISLALVAILLVAMTVSYLIETLPSEMRQFDADRFSVESPVIINTEARGVLLPLVNQIDPAHQVYAAYPDRLLADSGSWLALLSGGGTYLETLRYDATPERNARVRDLLIAAGFELEAQPIIWQGTRVTFYRVSPRGE